MKKSLLCILLCASGFLKSKTFAQNVAINEDGSAANPNAILDVKSFTKGILIPRVSTTGRLAISNTKGLLVFDTTAGSFFFNTGITWQSLTGNASVAAWSLTGNSNINASTQFIGTTDNNPIRLRLNNMWAGQLNPVSGNVAIGLNAGAGAGGSNNIAIGAGALRSNVSQSGLVAIGDSALFNNNNSGSTNPLVIDGAFNTAIGSKALLSNTVGFNNTAIGYRSLTTNSDGTSSTAIGAHALFSNSRGGGNTANGARALFENTTGSFNTAIGVDALSKNTFGHNNTAIGGKSLSKTTGSQFNTVLGYNAATRWNLGWNNTFLGANSDAGGNDFFNCIAIGESSVTTASNQARIGNSSTTSIGGFASWTDFSDGRYKKNIREDVTGLDFIMKLRPVTYQLDVTGISKKLNEGQGREKDELSKKSIAEKEKMVQTGFVAQEVEKAAKEAGYNFSGVDIPKSENEFYGLRYSEFVVPLVKAIQEQQRLITDLQKQVTELKRQVQRSK